MFNHLYALAPELIAQADKPHSVRKEAETEREKLVRQAQEHTLKQEKQLDDLAKCA
ncbi:hypothetical protein [Vibrio viridaestus]|uniref:hypothetical protein n=1 Tax=Vibrio viridaestus TaxID=2487322 RepID=UPI00140A51EB|nr:hypothetical protein [Vibrio viridaestus]